MLEKLAALEHEQWMHWSRSVLSELLDDLSSPANPVEIRDRVLKMHQRWLPLHVDYEELSEEMKEHDRVWARKVMEIAAESGKEERR